MTDGFAVDPDQQLREAPRFADASDELTAALQELQSTLAECADMCGDDEHGREFAAAYAPKADLVQQSLADGAQGVADVGVKVARMARNYADMEDVNERAARRGAGA